MHEVAGQLRRRVSVLDLLLVQLVGQVSNLVRLEWHVSIEDGVKANTGRPDVYWETLIANFLHDLGGNVGRSTALLEQKLVLVNAATDTEVANFDVTHAIEQNIVKLDVPVHDTDRVHVGDTLHNLLEEVLGVLLS